MVDDKEGWKNPKPHHHIINVTVCGSWWSGKPNEEGIPHSMCTDGTPNGHTVMHFDGQKYVLEYRAAGKPADYQMRLMAPEVVDLSDANAAAEKPVFHANVFNAMPGADVQWRFENDSSAAWQAMEKVLISDPVFQALWDEEQALKPDLPWRGLAKPMLSPHLFRGNLPTAEIAAGTYTISVKATNPNGQVLTGKRIIRVVE